jgi:hypothetical protein
MLGMYMCRFKLKKATKAIEHLAGAQKDHAEQKVVFNTNEDRR